MGDEVKDQPERSDVRPQVVIVLSGKRKSGKDYVAEELRRRVGADRCRLVRLSAPLKREYASRHPTQIDLERLMTSDAYKERFRADMIAWGERERSRDPDYFCARAVADCEAPADVVIVTDARRPTDLRYFRRRFAGKVRLVRVRAGDAVRIERGWCFRPGVDDAESECALDAGVRWDAVVDNDGDDVDRQLDLIVKRFLSLDFTEHAVL